MANPIKTVIIEDEPAAINRLKKELSQLSVANFQVVQELKSVGQTVAYLQTKPEVDLVLMDIQLTDGLSLEVFRQVEVPCPVIFTTAYDEYALQAFKVNSLDYLLKPINPEELAAAVERYLASVQVPYHGSTEKLLNLARQLHSQDHRSSFLVSSRHKMLLIATEDVAYLYIKERAVFLKKKDDHEYLVDFFLDDLENQLDPRQFYRANRQFLVARSAIQEIEPYFNGRLLLNLTPPTHTSVIISKEKATHFKRWADY